MDVKLYVGDLARQTCNSILKDGNYTQSDFGSARSKGYWKEDGRWIAYDNTTFDCWVEEFATRKEAKEWLIG